MPDVTLAPALIDTSAQESSQITVAPIGEPNPFFQGPPPPPVAPAINVVLGLKGMKVYPQA